MPASTSSKLIVTEWKSLQIDFLIIPPGNNRIEKALRLSGMDVNGVLGLKFANHDRYHPPGETIKDWIQGTTNNNEWNQRAPVVQLRKYLQLMTNMNPSHAYLVIVVGSRKILLWEMHIDGSSLKGLARLADM